MWSSGQTITVRNVRGGMVTHASAAIVVEDRPDRVVTYAPLGTGMRWSDMDWSTGTQSATYPQRRHTTDAVAIYTPGTRHTITAMYRGGGGPFICWYVDLVDPVRRVADGIVFCDQQLDIVIAPNRQWQWKDEDHVARCVELGWMTPAFAQSLRHEGEAVVERLARNAAPFNEPWPDWRADPAWPVPDLPANWATVPPV
jgi:Protein of unknown function (DUF402)